MDKHKQTILTALDYTSLLSDFEYDFINDLADKIDDFDFKLSARQEQVLNRIQAKIS